MRQIFIFTARDKDARAHLRDSILNPAPFDWMSTALTPDQAAYFQSLSPSADGFYAWGAVPGPVNERNWGAMQVGDVVLTVFDNTYHFLSSVTGKLNSKSLATRIWGTDDKGNTWEYMYFLSKPQPIHASVVDGLAPIYLNKGYRGFTRISDEKTRAIVQTFGSLEAFVEQAFQGQIPETHFERELQEIALEAESVDPFSPKDLVDGRKKVLQEIVRRQGQPKFRKQLLAAYDGRCTVTGCDVEAVLEAAHIAPYLGKDSNSVQNGLLLRADIHTLFDLGMLKVDAKGTVHLHEKLRGTVYEQYGDQFIRLPADKALAPSPEALDLKFNVVL
ncbi:HNH endonuclease [Pseudomonas sp. PDM19]|uniref:HNH endonuclease n=1 Tax=Pseudomonas sp. PDM19 TaxID=2769272 RepID=UPI001CE0F96D|nr:HNH endonuclease [Pseudomonas sp. PDM19]